MSEEPEVTLEEENKVIPEKEVEKEKKEEPKNTEKEELIEALRKEFAEKIRKEEKDKLYPTMEKYKQEIKEKEEANKVLALKMKEYEDSHLSGEEKIQKQLQELLDANDTLSKQLENVSEVAAKEIYAIQLEAAREKALARYGNDIIPEMVSGNTIEEIYQSAEKANSVYLTIKAKAEEDAKAKSKTVPMGTNISPKNPGAGSLEMDIQDIKNIKDPAEFEKIKEKLLAKALA
jgi:hypothetical protein